MRRVRTGERRARISLRKGHHIVNSPISQVALLPFYPTATTVLFVLLITWLVAEARELREDLNGAGGAAPLEPGIVRARSAAILAVALVLALANVVALRVQFRGEAASWEEIIVWAALGLGFVGVGFSLVMAVLASRDVASAAPPISLLGVCKRWLAPAVALLFGLLASPLVRHDTVVRHVGAKFAVYGTCVSGGCGLKQRRGPGPQFPEVDPNDRIKDGEQVLVVCQSLGTPPKGFTSRVWDLLPNGRYVSDAFVDTPSRSGVRSSELPRCPRSATKTPAG